jgi:N-methylhydantoinase A
VAEELDMPTVLVPRAGGVLSALGLAIADLRRDYVTPYPCGLDEADAARVEASFAAMERDGRRDLAPHAPAMAREADLRYRGQSFELTVDAGGLASTPAADLGERFLAAHQRRYGYRMQDEPVELVSLRVTATVPGRRPALHEPPAGSDPITDRRATHVDGRWVDAPVLDRRRMGAGSAVEGPAIVEFPEATCVVRPGWSGSVDDAGTLVLEHG